MECGDELSGDRGECTCECEIELLERFEMRCADFVDFALELLFFIVWTLIASSVGGLGRLRSICYLRFDGFSAWTQAGEVVV